MFSSSPLLIYTLFYKILRSARLWNNWKVSSMKAWMKGEVEFQLEISLSISQLLKAVPTASQIVENSLVPLVLMLAQEQYCTCVRSLILGVEVED